MKLSDAILKGCEGTVKIRGYFTTAMLASMPENGCCVMGAALVGVFSLQKAREIDVGCCCMAAIEKEFNVDYTGAIIQEAVKRNNDTNESRESIAAWLATKGL